MRIIVELETADKDITAEEIERDLKMAEDQIGWNYYYVVRSVHVEQTSKAMEDRSGDEV